ncbi:MAG: 3-deoxy-manno-octulosonate cytidylyltransferase [Lachnospiraceae bacterium]|nr:3-deoxy-manno-octulosonate cytidylyltransferase [Lachnospiraceae bacterium]
MKIIGVIPARYLSSRFPGKPLADILGKPMVWWVYNQAIKVKRLEEVYVATDDERIMTVCDNFKIPVIMTSSKHINGSERLSEVADKIEADIYVTIQGDEPLLEPEIIERVLDTILQAPDIQCATLKTPYKNPVDVINSTTPKVVTDLDNNILLLTRSAVPYPKAALNYIIYKPIGVYAFKRDILQKYKTLSIGPLESAEEIELLRLIEHGYKVRIQEVESETIAVDTEKDLRRVIDILKTKE